MREEYEYFDFNISDISDEYFRYIENDIETLQISFVKKHLSAVLNDDTIIVSNFILSKTFLLVEFKTLLEDESFILCGLSSVRNTTPENIQERPEVQYFLTISWTMTNRTTKQSYTHDAVYDC